MKGVDGMKSKSVRTAGIIIAVILGMAALFYLGGLVNQLTIGYQKWLADGGMTGKATMGTIYFSPLVCWRSAMTLSGLKCTFFVAALSGGLYLVIRLYNRFGSNDYDPRNFTRSKRGTYGTSGWMSEKEMREVLEIASPERAKGIILGKTEGGSVICLPEDTRLNKHIAVFGASGTRKSRGVIRPALFQSIRRGESVVVADPKSEMFADTAGLFKKHGYKVRVYNLLQPEYSDSWNCMFDLGGDTLMAQILTDVIISNTKGDEKGDHFWDNGESNLLKSLILYVDLDTTRTPEERNLPAVYQMLTQHTEKELTMLFDRLPNDDLLIIIRGQKVLRAKKFDFTEHPYAKECERTSIQNYHSDHVPVQPPEAPEQSAPMAPGVTEPPEPVPAALEKLSAEEEAPPAPPVESVPKAPPSSSQPAEFPSKPARRPKTLYERSRPPADF